MSWDHAACELEEYLPWDKQVTLGTGGNRKYGVPPLRLPLLERDVRLYDVTVAWIQETWGNQDDMPSAGKKAWDHLLMVSRTIPLTNSNAEDNAILAASLNEWAEWMQSEEARMAEPKKPMGQAGNMSLTNSTSSLPPPQVDVDWRSVVAAVVDDNALAIIDIASDDTKTTDEKMRSVYAIDNRAVGWDSPKWAKVLSVTDAAVRKTDWWKVDRPRLRG